MIKAHWWRSAYDQGFMNDWLMVIRPVVEYLWFVWHHRLNRFLRFDIGVRIIRSQMLRCQRPIVNVMIHSKCIGLPRDSSYRSCHDLAGKTPFVAGWNRSPSHSHFIVLAWWALFKISGGDLKCWPERLNYEY